MSRALYLALSLVVAAAAVSLPAYADQVATPTGAPEAPDAKVQQISQLVEQAWGLIGQQKNAEALPLLEQARDLAGDPADPSPVTAYVLKALGNAYANTGQFDKAETADLRAYAIEQAVFGGDDPRVIESTANLGILYVQMNQPAKAEPYLAKALDIINAKMGPDSPQASYALKLLGAVHDKMGRTADAKAEFDHAAAIDAKQK